MVNGRPLKLFLLGHPKRSTKKNLSRGLGQFCFLAYPQAIGITEEDASNLPVHILAFLVSTSVQPSQGLVSPFLTGMVL